MNLKEVLKMADEMVFAKTGQHLDNLQEAILRGTLQDETYTQIAKEKHCDESYVRDVGSKLWQLLSQELGQKVKKSNFRATMQRLQIPIVSHLEQHHNQISSVNFCGDTRHLSNIQNSNPSNEPTSNAQQTPTLHHDLSEMPRLGTFYDRTSELQTLQTLILTEKTQLITINGISGIGKTALATQLVQQIKNEFQYIIWCSLETSPTLPLTGLDTTAAREIFKEEGLEQQDYWDLLINYYQGNPLWLKSVANMIVELGCDATELLQNNTIFLPEDLKDVLQQQFNRLSEIEKQVMFLLARENEPVNLAKLLENSIVTSSDLLNALQSLSRRCLIKKSENLYTLLPVLRQYIIDR